MNAVYVDGYVAALVDNEIAVIDRMPSSLSYIVQLCRNQKYFCPTNHFSTILCNRNK